jgi:hypothetical protein
VLGLVVLGETLRTVEYRLFALVAAIPGDGGGHRGAGAQ